MTLFYKRILSHNNIYNIYISILVGYGFCLHHLDDCFTKMVFFEKFFKITATFFGNLYICFFFWADLTKKFNHDEIYIQLYGFKTIQKRIQTLTCMHT